MLISTLAAVLRINAREAPLFMLERLVLESSREFFRKSRAWRLDFGGPILTGQDAYDFTVPTDALIYDVIFAKLSDGNTKLIYQRDAGKAYISPSEEDSTTVGAKYITLVDTDTFVLSPLPKEDDTIELRVALTLNRDATNIDDAIVEQYEDAILDGALYRLYEQPNETWSDIRMSQLHRGKFLGATEEARLRIQETRTPGARTASFSW